MRMHFWMVLGAFALGGCGGSGDDVQAVRHALSLTRIGQGRVVSAPAGLDCGSTCSAAFDAGTVVALTATADPGWRFEGFSGACSGAECALTLDAGQQVTASFVEEPVTPPPEARALSVARVGEGRVVSAPAGLDCGSACSAYFDDGAVVTLAATAADGWFFRSWNGACTGAESCALTMTADLSVGALFAPAAPVGRWLLGDTHVHNDHSGDGSGTRQGTDQRGPGNVSVADQVGQGVLNGLDWMPLTDHRTYSQHYDPLWESADLLLVPGEEANGSPHSTVMGAVDWIVQGAGRPGTPDVDRLQTSIWDAHAQGASWGIAHPDDGEITDDGTPNTRASAIGMDTVETWNRASGVEKEVDYAETRWNRGWRFGMAGASDNHFRELWATAGPGMPATGVFAPALSERAIVQGLQAGRTRIALDPPAIAPAALLEADFQGDGVYEAICGDEVIAPTATAGKLRVRAVNAVGATVLLYKSPGRSAGAFRTFAPDASEVEYLVDVAVEGQPTWYRVEIRGPGQATGVDTNDPTATPDGADQLRAVCSPIFVSSAPVSPMPEFEMPADQGGDDGAALALGDFGGFAAFPDLAVAGDVTHLVAEQHALARTAIVYRRVGADGPPGAPFELAPASDSARFPRVAARGADIWVVWQDERAGQVPRRPAIYLRHSSDGGQSWAAELKLREIAGRAEHPAIAVGATGQPVVVWQEISAGNPFDVMAQVVGVDGAPVNLSRAGKAIAAANAYDTRSARYPASVWPAVAVAADGRIAVAFQDNRTDPDPLWTGQLSVGDSSDVDDWQVMVSLRPADASAWNAPVGFGAADRADRHPAIAFAPDGALIAAWDSVCLNSAGCNVEVLSARSTNGGVPWPAPVKIAESAVGMSQYPRLGNDPAGAVRAVWYDSRSDDWRWRVMTAVNDAIGNWMAVTMLPGRGVNTWPATAGGRIAFASTRNATRLQRDRTQQIFLAAP